MDYLRTFALALAMIFSATLHAASVENLYRASVETPSGITEPSDEAVIQGLQQVLVKVSGDADILSNAYIQQQLPGARNLLQQFTAIAGTSDQASQLMLDFNADAINNMISHSGVKPMGSQRPVLLVWLLAEQVRQKDFIPYGSDELSVIEAEAAVRGLPLQLPLLDLQDQTALAVTDAWGLFEAPVQAASQRYNTDSVIVAKLEPIANEQARLSWIQITPQGQVQRYSESGEQAMLLKQLVNRAADELFNPVPVVSHGLSHFQQGTALEVSGVNALADYLSILRFVQSLPVVNKVVLEYVQGNRLRFRVQLDGSEQQLQQAIGIESRLQVMEQQLNSDGSLSLTYHWQG